MQNFYTIILKMKTIDVIIPVYNGLPYVQRTLDSVIKQSYRPNKIIVVNDGSTDKTAEEIEKIIKQNPQVDIELLNKKNGGHSSATNYGIKHSKAEYIALVDADDLWHPNKLEKQISVFNRSTDPKLGVVYCDFASIDTEDQFFDFPTFKLDTNAKGNIYHALLKRGNLVAGSNSAVLVKREVFNQFPHFDEKLRCGEDWEMWICMAQKYHFDFYPEKLTFIRRHPNALSNENMLHTHSNIYILHKWKKQVREVVGLNGMINHLSNAPVGNLKKLLLDEKYQYLIKELEDIFPMSSGKLLVGIALAYKAIRKVFRNVTMSQE